MAYLGNSCPTPVDYCHGMRITEGVGSERQGRRMKYHSDNIEALNCYGSYLQSQGYEKKSRREFKHPQTGEIHVLSKKIGHPVMSGKGGDKAKTKRTIGKQHSITVK